MCSWIAVKGVPKGKLLKAVGLVEAGKARQVFPGCRDADFSIRRRPNGWTVIAAEDFDWASRERILELSRLGPTVGLQFEDKVEMESIATGAENGIELWRVYHSNEPKKPKLEVSGEPPMEFADIRDRLMKLQTEKNDCDYVHDIPLETAKAVCGYRLDEEDEPFFALKAAGAEDGPDETEEREPLFGWRYSPAQAEYARRQPYLDCGPMVNVGPRRKDARSWIAVKGAPLETFLRAVGLKALGPRAENSIEPSSYFYAQSQKGWTTIMCHRWNWASRRRILALSRLWPTVGGQIEGGVHLESIAVGAEGGAELWRVRHWFSPRTGPLLNIEGSPPPEFAEIQNQLLRKQEENDKGKADIDFLHEAPIQLGDAVTGLHLTDKFTGLVRKEGPYKTFLNWLHIYD